MTKISNAPKTMKSIHDIKILSADAARISADQKRAALDRDKLIATMGQIESAFTNGEYETRVRDSLTAVVLGKLRGAGYTVEVTTECDFIEHRISW